MKHTHYLHPGEILKLDYLEGHQLSVAAAAQAMQMPRTRLNDIVRGRRSITPDSALRLAKFFGGSAQFWLNLQSHYDLAEAETSAKAANSLDAIRPISQVGSHA